jgi:acetate kinase
MKIHVVDANGAASARAAIEDIDAGAVDAVAHRLVHGGSRYREPVLVDAGVRAALTELEELAPLHTRPALHALDACTARFPALPEVTVFDTEFHSTIPPEASVFAVPEAWRETYGLRRYGFHGLSVQWAVERASEISGVSLGSLRGVVCHLGGGSSVTAIAEGRSVDTTMGFSPLDGVPMTTRSGALDPGALVHLMRVTGMQPDAIEDALERESGMRALGGGTGDMRDIERAASDGEPQAQLAFDHYVLRVAGAVSAMAVSAGGLDALVFTAGIGENSPNVRAAICDRLGFLGPELDPDANRRAKVDGDPGDPLTRRADRGPARPHCARLTRYSERTNAVGAAGEGDRRTADDGPAALAVGGVVDRGDEDAGAAVDGEGKRAVRVGRGGGDRLGRIGHHRPAGRDRAGVDADGDAADRRAGAGAAGRVPQIDAAHL